MLLIGLRVGFEAERRRVRSPLGAPDNGAVRLTAKDTRPLSLGNSGATPLPLPKFAREVFPGGMTVS